jgi:hypothetical protein
MTWGVLKTKPEKPQAEPAPPEDYGTIGPKTCDSYPRKTINILSVAQLLCGVACIALGIVRIYVTEHVHKVRYDVGICEGAFFLMTGIIGITSTVSKTRGLIISAAVSSALSCVLALFLGIGWLAFGLLRRDCRSSFHGRHHDSDEKDEDDDDRIRKRPYNHDKPKHDESWLHRKDQDGPGRHHDNRPHHDVPPFLYEKFLIMRVVDWILLALFVTVIVCSIVVFVKAIQALKRRRRESIVDTQETQVFVITPEKGAVLS